MINEDFVTTLKTKWMTTEINVLREYLQHNFLNNSEKIDALLTRSKSRDFFDLYYILRARLGTKVVIERRDAILELIEKTKGSFVDLKQFLPKNFWPIKLPRAYPRGINLFQTSFVRCLLVLAFECIFLSWIH